MGTIEGLVKNVRGYIDEQGSSFFRRLFFGPNYIPHIYRMLIDIESDNSHVMTLHFRGCWPIRNDDYIRAEIGDPWVMTPRIMVRDEEKWGKSYDEARASIIEVLKDGKIVATYQDRDD